MSWGAILAQEFYRLHAERFISLILADTYAGWRGSLPDTTWKARLAACLRMAGGPPDAVVSEFHPIGFRLMSLSSAEVDTTDLLPNVEVNTLVLWGDDDRRSPLHIARQLCASTPNAKLAIIPNAGHVSNMEQADAFNREVGGFCRSVHVA